MNFKNKKNMIYKFIKNWWDFDVKYDKNNIYIISLNLLDPTLLKNVPKDVLEIYDKPKFEFIMLPELLIHGINIDDLESINYANQYAFTRKVKYSYLGK